MDTSISEAEAWLQALNAILNTVQIVGLALIAAVWRYENGKK